jgi:hypothetical protein
MVVTSNKSGRRRWINILICLAVLSIFIMAVSVPIGGAIGLSCAGIALVLNRARSSTG